MAAQGPPGAAMAMAAPEPQPGRCAHFVLRKKRFCRMIPAPGRRFCGEHGHEEEQNDRKRIPCPLDPKHTVYEDQLQKHLKKCNSRDKPKPVYFVQDINAGLKDVSEIPEKQVPLSSLSIEELQNLITRLKKASNGLELHLKEQILSHQALQEALSDPKNGESAFKHLKQQVDGKHKRRDSIFERLQVDIQHLCLNKVPILEKKKLPVVGIGKHLCGAATDLALRCLVESYTTCCDGKDEEPAPKRCRAAQTEVAPHKSAGNESTTEDHKPVAGIVIALCCHHKCDWTHYVGREFFKSVGLGPVEFHYFQRMSSWATCGMQETTGKASTSEDSEDHTNDTEEHEHTLSSTASGSDTLQGTLSVEERKELGCLCKRLIDHGRIEYLQQQGYKAALQYYTEAAVSLENVLLTAVPNPSVIPEPTI
ncbi:tRNA:m(4)X modification enzyme TRM13 homolog isoform X1 [Ammospiza nelsoni]|uniref:tRNA:m(4)X modification enzyme TRM13 homolog isoform X1 n=1 Tax=Ammospiza caudacuta TaxID=2857398 RepID=UPI0027388F92|nr:tRNA:m(4)X modification enzyme TRM13 homolog isoform X1 [Ammospiza caudacuta]XP_059334542.1 tRNA:m(4)X modification enzyme TRM13 homolog isoform X1 [Ammospiza nelsoni]